MRYARRTLGESVSWDNGGSAELVALDGDRVTLRSTVPSPPGSRIEGVLSVGGRLRVKIHGAKRQEDGTFLLEGRALDLTREVRARLGTR
jgi:hypothetical protein